MLRRISCEFKPLAQCRRTHPCEQVFLDFQFQVFFWVIFRVLITDREMSVHVGQNLLLSHLFVVNQTLLTESSTFSVMHITHFMSNF